MMTRQTENDIERNHIEQDRVILVFDETKVFSDLWKYAGSKALVRLCFTSGLGNHCLVCSIAIGQGYHHSVGWR